MIEYGPIIEKLLAGDFICDTTDQHNFHKLQQDDIFSAVNDYLKPLNRRVACNDDKTVFFLSYVHIDESARKHIQHSFTQTMQALLPMLEFMQLVQEAAGQDGALDQGDTIKLHEFSLKIEDNQSLKVRLAQLASTTLFRSHSDSIEQQIKLLFKRVKELGFLYQPHSDRQIYYVTGKIEHLIELVRFIKDQENIEFEEPEPTQGDLL
jgi:hypothetical protein